MAHDCTRQHMLLPRAVIGILFVSSAFSDGRGDRIDEFKASVDVWADGTVNEFSTSTGWKYQVQNSCSASANATRDLTSSDAAEQLGSESSETDVFAAYTRVKFADVDPSVAGTITQSATSCILQVSIMSEDEIVGNVTTMAVERSILSFSSLCTRTETKDKNGRTRSNESSDVSTCHSRCSSRRGTSTGSSYSSFECVIVDHPVEICVRVSKNSGGWFIPQGTLPDRPSGASGAGCFRESSSWAVDRREAFSGSATLRVPVQIRHERDPYLYFLDISDGTLNFGLSTGEKLKIGFSLLIIGFIITATICGACYCIVKFAWSFAKGGQTERPQNAVGGALYDVSAKYGAYIPGGATAVGVPVMAGQVPTGHVQKGPPGVNVPPPGYSIGSQPYEAPGSPPGVAGYPYDHSPYGSPTAVQPGYGGAAPPPGYGGGPGYGGTDQNAPPPGYGAPPPGYGAPQPGYGAPNAPPPGYGAPPTNAPPPGYGAPPPPAGYPPTF